MCAAAVDWHGGTVIGEGGAQAGGSSPIPRRSLTVGICGSIAGKGNVLHVDIEPGTGTALFNVLFTYVVYQRWHDKDFIARCMKDFDAAVQANKLSLQGDEQDHWRPGRQAQARGRLGLQAKGSGHRPHAMHVYEKSIICATTTPDPVGVGRPRTGNPQRWPLRDRSLPHGRPPGGLHPPALPR